MPGVDGRDQQHAGSFEAPPGYLRRLGGSMMVTKTGEGSDARLSGMRLSAGPIAAIEPMVSTVRVFESLSG